MYYGKNLLFFVKYTQSMKCLSHRYSSVVGRYLAVGEDTEAGLGEKGGGKPREESVLKDSAAEGDSGKTGSFSGLFTGSGCPSGKALVKSVSGAVLMGGGKFQSHCRLTLEAAFTFQPQHGGTGIEQPTGAGGFYAVHIVLYLEIYCRKLRRGDKTVGRMTGC